MAEIQAEGKVTDGFSKAIIAIDWSGTIYQVGYENINRDKTTSRKLGFDNMTFWSCMY